MFNILFAILGAVALSDNINGNPSMDNFKPTYRKLRENRKWWQSKYYI